MVRNELAKKVAISITIDGDVLRTLDGTLREIQSKELSKGRLSSNRSTLIERIVRDWVEEGH
jgi:metal-responsive CopG/Arc/MetJ family transcriptional regulator